MVTINNGIVRTFVFHNEVDGCLNAKYMNEDERLPYGETCVLKNRNRNLQGFAGDYSATWFEQNDQQVAANLSIVQNPDNNAGSANTFHLEWTRDDNTRIFEGIGMLYGDLLVGTYWEIRE